MIKYEYEYTYSEWDDDIVFLEDLVNYLKDVQMASTTSHHIQRLEQIIKRGALCDGRTAKRKVKL
jgi:hypothetical protein